MHVVQASFFQPGFSVYTTDDKLENSRRDIFLKMFSTLKKEEWKAGMGVCKYWQRILLPQVNCKRLLELMQAYQEKVPEKGLEIAQMIGELESQLLNCDHVLSDKIFQETWFKFAKKCSAEACSSELFSTLNLQNCDDIWSNRIFKETSLAYAKKSSAEACSPELFLMHHFSTLYVCIESLTHIAAKGMSAREKMNLQNELVNKFSASGQSIAAAETFLEMDVVENRKGENLIPPCRYLGNDELAVRVAEKIDVLYRVLSQVVGDLKRSEKYDPALDLIKKFDTKTNTARLLLGLSTGLKESLNPWAPKLSNDEARAIVSRMAQISFECKKDPEGFRNSNEDLMTFFVDGLLARGMAHEATQVYYILEPYVHYEDAGKALKKIQKFKA